MSDAEWSVAVPSRHVDGDGAVQVEIDLADASTGQVTSFSLTVDPQRRAVVTASGEALADFRA